MITFNKQKINEYCNISILLICIIFIVVYSSLNADHRKFIGELLTNDIPLALAVIVITIFSYYNLIGGFVLSIMYIIMILPYFMNNRKKLDSNNIAIAEGFTTSKSKNSKSNNKKKTINVGPEGKKEMEEVDLFAAITGKGERIEKFKEKIAKYKQHKAREEVYNKLNDNTSPVIEAKYKTHSDSYSNSRNTNTEDNIDEDNILESKFKREKTEGFNEGATIKMRKFNPNDEFDNNLLMTKEICDDIKKRIVYEYETIPYLKRYISSRLQEIIDLLDLSA